LGQWVPVGGRIMIEVYKKEKSEGGVILPENEWSTHYLEAKVLAVGPGKRVENLSLPEVPNTDEFISVDVRQSPEVHVGDRIRVDRAFLNNPSHATPLEKREDNRIYFITESSILDVWQE
jgi:co-chaperonin GroES (HSP10)